MRSLIYIKAKAVADDDLAEWYARNKSTLDANHKTRDLNLVVAVRLLPIFEQRPDAWRVVRSLNAGDPSENESLETYLAGWYSRVDAADKQVVEEIAKLLSASH